MSGNSKLKRKPPKRVGASGRPGFPKSLTLPADEWDALYKLAKWIEDAPVDVQLSDHAWDQITDQLHGPVEDLLARHALGGTDDPMLMCAGVETAGRKLITLLDTEESITAGETEHRCILKRGRRK